MPVKTQRNAGNLGQRVHGSPGAAPALRVAEHPVGAFVRASVAAILAGKSSVRANRLDHALPAGRPVVALDQPYAVGADFLLCNIVAVAGGTTGAVVRRILLRLVGTQILSTFIDDRCAAENHHAHAGFCGSRAGACAGGRDCVEGRDGGASGDF